MTSRTNGMAAAVLLLLPGLSPARAQERSAPLTRGLADAILNELRQIRRLLERPTQQASPVTAPAASPVEHVKVGTAGSYSLGSSDAALTLVEFTDYQCPFCKQFHDTTFQQLKTNYIDTGRLRFVHRDLPLDFHEHALKAAQAARCAGEQDKFWPM